MTDGRKSTLDSDQIQVEQQTELVYKEDTIWTAIFNADKSAIDLLIENDENVVNTRGAVGECPIHMLFLYSSDEHLEIARDLITRFPSIVTQIYNGPIYYGENILHIAIVKQNSTMVKWLLSNSKLEPYRKELLKATATGEFFKIGKPSYYGETPLGFACCTKQWNIVEILLKYGADINAVDSNGNTIFHVLVICNVPEIYEKIKAYVIEHEESSQLTNTRHKKIDKLKVKEEIQLWNQTNNDDLTPLTLAADLGRIKMLSWLLYERKIIQWSYGDVSCVLHPLDQLDVDFQENVKKRRLSVLEIIIKNNFSELIHPIIISLIDKKWKYFAYRILIRRFFLTFTYLLIFLATTILEQTRPETMNTYANTFQLIACGLGNLIVLGGAVYKFIEEIGEMRSMSLRNYLNTTGSIFLENCLACSFCFCIFLIQFFRLLEITHETVILSIASIIGWGYMFFFIMPFRFTGPFVIMIYKMLFNDVLRFCIIYIIFLGGFSQSFFVLFDENGLQGYFSSIKHCFLGLLGDFDLEHYTDSPHPLASVALLILYVVVITILLLNLLIAMMGDTYADVKRSAKKLWHLERARIALDVESGMSTAVRKLKINKYWVDIQGQRYLQVEQINNELFQSKENEMNDD